MLDIVWRCDKDNKVEYVWFDTGIEYQATKDHLKYLEEKYDIHIRGYKAIKPVPVSCKTYGQPFLSKQVSEFMQRLQSHNFKWEDESYENLIEKYPKCKSALEWWCDVKGDSSLFGIQRNKYLKSFIMKYPPNFKISNKCCLYAKKKIGHNLMKNETAGHNSFDLLMTGIRKAEGGARATAYKSCFDENASTYDNYRPIFWYKNKDKKDYEIAYGIHHSDCYTKYGLTRTGCACCPYARGGELEFELEAINKYEPKLYKAVNYIFKDSYEYTKKYREFCKEMKSQKKRE